MSAEIMQKQQGRKIHARRVSAMEQWEKAGATRKTTVDGGVIEASLGLRVYGPEVCRRSGREVTWTSQTAEVP